MMNTEEKTILYRAGCRWESRAPECTDDAVRPWWLLRFPSGTWPDARPAVHRSPTRRANRWCTGKKCWSSVNSIRIKSWASLSSSCWITRVFMGISLSRTSWVLEVTLAMKRRRRCSLRRWSGGRSRVNSCRDSMANALPSAVTSPGSSRQ